MQFKDRVAEPNCHQTPVNDIKSRSFLGDKEHALSLAQALGDDVGDGLALPGPGRPDENEVTSLRSRNDCGELRTVDGQWCEQISGNAAPIDLFGGYGSA